jgi:hypothetical protein
MRISWPWPKRSAVSSTGKLGGVGATALAEAPVGDDKRTLESTYNILLRLSLNARRYAIFLTRPSLIAQDKYLQYLKAERIAPLVCGGLQRGHTSFQWF